MLEVRKYEKVETIGWSYGDLFYSYMPGNQKVSNTYGYGYMGHRHQF